MAGHQQHDLPEGWCRPTINEQPTFFPQPSDEALATLDVTRGDLRRWRELGWISFDIDVTAQIDDPEACEIGFVRNLARSGLTITQINEFLADLPKPYRYSPQNTTYHFVYGWMTPVREKPRWPVNLDLRECIEQLADEGDIDGLTELGQLIVKHLESFESDDEEEK